MIKYDEKTEKKVLVSSIDSIDLDDKYDEVMDFISEEAKAEAFTAGLVFEELFVNIYNYAYEDMKESKDSKENGPVNIKIEHAPNHIRIILADFGIPFNPIQRANWVAQAKQIGGRGIDLVKSYSNSFKYKRVYDMNIVEVVILTEPPEE